MYVYCQLDIKQRDVWAIYAINKKLIIFPSISVLKTPKTTSMAAPNHQVNHEYESGELPQILVLEPPPIMQLYGDQFLKDFRVLKAWESPLPLEQFLTTHAHSVQALLSSGRYLLTGNIIRLLPSLRLVVTTSAGLNHIDLPECQRRGIAIANAGDVYSEDVADMAVGLLIDVLRKVSAADRYMRKGLWPTKGEFPLGSKVIISV
jgi:hydroxypyruvate reductase 2